MKAGGPPPSTKETEAAQINSMGQAGAIQSRRARLTISKELLGQERGFRRRTNKVGHDFSQKDAGQGYHHDGTRPVAVGEGTKRDGEENA